MVPEASDTPEQRSSSVNPRAKVGVDRSSAPDAVGEVATVVRKRGRPKKGEDKSREVVSQDGGQANEGISRASVTKSKTKKGGEKALQEVDLSAAKQDSTTKKSRGKGKEKPSHSIANESASNGRKNEGAVEGGSEKADARSRLKKGEENEKKNIGKEGNPSESSTSETVTKVERRGRPKKGQEKNTKAKQAAKRLSFNFASSSAVPDVAVQMDTSETRNVRGQYGDVDKGGIRPEEEIGSSRAGVQTPTLNNPLEKEKPKKILERKVGGKRKADAILDETRSKVQHRKRGGQHEVQETETDYIMQEAQQEEQPVASKRNHPGEITKLRDTQQDQMSNVDSTASSLPDTSMTPEVTVRKRSAVPLHKFPPKRSPISSKAALASEAKLKMEVVVKQVQKMLSEGQGRFSTLAPSTAAFQRNIKEGRRIACYMGPVQQQSLQTLPVNTGRCLTELVNDEEKQGCLLNAGGHIYSLDWRLDHDTDSPNDQYICISASIDDNPRTLIGEKVSKILSSAQVQIWSVSKDFEAKLKMILCFDQGRISSVRWLPISEAIGRKGESLGLLSACMQDGSIGIYTVPHPNLVRLHGDDKVPMLKVDPLIQLNVNKGVPTCSAWYNSDKLAIGYSDGWVSIWSLIKCFQAGSSKRARPLTFARVSSSPTSCISWDTSGQQVFVSAYDGSARCMQLAHPHLSTNLYHSRGERSESRLGQYEFAHAPSPFCRCVLCR